MLTQRALRPLWVSFQGFVGLLVGVIGIAIYVIDGTFAPLLLGLAGGSIAFVLLWPRLSVQGEVVVVRNLRTQRFELENVRGIIPSNDGLAGARYDLDLVAEPTTAVWAMYVPAQFGRVGTRRMQERADRVSAIIREASK